MCLYKKTIHTEDDIWYAEHLTKHGFREVRIFFISYYYSRA